VFFFIVSESGNSEIWVHTWGCLPWNRFIIVLKSPEVVRPQGLFSAVCRSHVSSHRIPRWMHVTASCGLVVTS
jgi:hypothetical protein